MAGERKLTVVLAGDARGLQRALGQVDGNVKGLGGKFRSLGKFAAIGGAAAAAGIAVIGKSAVDSLMRIETIGAQTDAVIKSTGGVAGVTRKQIDDLAGSIEDLTSVEAETVTEGQNLLLTFTRIQNKAGEGNDIFDQATEAMVDLSVAMDKDMGSAAQLVGKALNDPIAGLTALNRAGVQFTDDQKATIKRMVEMGDVTGAQAIILGELNTQFGGSAEALGDTLQGRIEKVKHRFGTFTEEIAARLLPAVEAFVEWLVDKAIPALDDAAAAVQSFVDDALVVLGNWWDEHGQTVIAAAETMADAIETAFDVLVAAAKFVIEEWDKFKYVVGTVATYVITRYVAMQVAALISSAIQAAAWVAATAAAALSKVQTAIIIGLMIADWVKLAVVAALNAAKVAAAWVVTQVAASRAAFVHGAATATMMGSWTALAAHSIAKAGAVVGAWKLVLGKISLVVAAGVAASELLDRLTGVNRGTWADNWKTWLNPFDPDNVIRRFHQGGVFQAPGGAREGLALLESGERVLSRRDTAALSRSDSMMAPAHSGVPSINIDLRGAIVTDDIAFERIVRDTLQRTVSRQGRIPGTNIVKATA